MALEKKNRKNSRLNQVKITDVVFMTLRGWPWIILSVVVCVGLAVLYVLRTPSIYTRTASIVIKDDSKGKSVSSELDAFSDMGLIQTHSNILDEVNKLQSRDVIREVIKRMNLDISYFVEGRFHKDLTYGPQLPVSVSFPDARESESISINLNLTNDGKYVISELTYNGEEKTLPNTTSVDLGDTINSVAGRIVVEKTPYYTNHHPQKIQIVKSPLKAVSADFSSRLDVTQKSEKGNTINLTFTDQSTQRAEDFINGVITVYNEKWMENRNQISVSTSNFINDRLGVIEGELGNVDQDIYSYQSEHLIPDVQQAASMYMTENQATSAKLLDLNTQLQMARHLRGYLNGEAHNTQVLPTNSGIQNPTIESQIAEYNETMLQRNQYAANSSETHPRVMDLDSKLAGMRTSILATLDNQIAALNTQIKSLQSSKNRTTAQIAANPTQAKYLLSVERQQKVKEALYLFLLQKREENELSQAFTAYNTQIITTPDGTDVPTAPKKKQIIMMAFVIGLIIPFGVNYVRESNNTKVRGKKDLENLNIPLLGEIPSYKVKKGEDATKTIVVKQGKRNVINEAFRILRTNIGFIAAKDKGCCSIMVTSFNPGSGKTFLTINLGISLAIKGKKVLIIDGDLRRATTSSYIDTPKIGLSNYLIGEVSDVNSVIVNNSLADGLSILPVGTIPPNPTELLETERFTDMVKNLKNEYDYILIDCPPVEMMADAQIIDQVVERTIFVIRAGLLDRNMLVELEKMSEEKKLKNVGVVLNATIADGHRYGYKYGYGYGYGYGNYNHYNSDKE